MPINVRLSNFQPVVDYLKTLPRGVKVVGMRAASEYAVGNESHGLKWYPAKPPNSKYIRTFNLRNSWYINESNSDWGRVQIGNTMPYAPFVVGDKEQAWMHVGRWRTVTANIRDNMAGAIRAAQAAVNALIRSRKSG